MLELALQIVSCLLISAFIGFLIGYITGRNISQKYHPDTTQETTKEPLTQGKDLEEKIEKKPTKTE